MKAFEIPDILESLKSDVVSGKITIREAADELYRSGRMNYIDEEKAKRLLHLEEQEVALPRKFNPFYDSDFLVSREGSEDRRLLVELYRDELEQLRAEIDAVLERTYEVKRVKDYTHTRLERGVFVKNVVTEEYEELCRIKNGYEEDAYLLAEKRAVRTNEAFGYTYDLTDMIVQERKAYIVYDDWKFEDVPSLEDKLTAAEERSTETGGSDVGKDEFLKE